MSNPSGEAIDIPQDAISFDDQGRVIIADEDLVRALKEGKTMQPMINFGCDKRCE